MVPLAQELARLQIEDRLMGGAPVTAHEVAARGEAMLGRDPEEVPSPVSRAASKMIPTFIMMSMKHESADTNDRR